MSPDKIIHFAINFKMFCEYSDMSYNEICESIGVSRQTLYCYFKGVRLPNHIVMNKICVLFMTSFEEITSNLSPEKINSVMLSKLKNLNIRIAHIEQKIKKRTCGLHEELDLLNIEKQKVIDNLKYVPK